MTETVLRLHLFYPMLFTTIIVLGIIIGLVVTKTKDNGLFNNIFNKHTDEHIDTTSKMKDMHDNVIQVPYTDKQEKELHNIETRLAKIEEDFQILSDKLDEFIAKVIELESK